MHDRHARIYGCGLHNWRGCETFAVARIRGTGRTVYAIGCEDGFRIVIDWTDGPSDAVGGWISEFTIRNWGHAMVQALALVLSENPEVTMD